MHKNGDLTFAYREVIQNRRFIFLNIITYRT